MPDGFPHLAQHRFLWDQHRFVWALGGVQSGKTEVGKVQAGYAALRAGPRSTGLVIAPTYGILRTATMQKFVDGWRPLIESVNHGTYDVRMVHGQRIHFRSATEPDHFRGITADWLWGDEVAYWTREAFEVALGRLVATGGPAFFTTTPNGFNFVHDIYADQSAQREQHAFYRFSSFENPGADQEYLAALRSQMSEDFARQELFAEFLAPGKGRVYAQFVRENAVLQTVRYDPALPVFVGLDFGYRNPAALAIQVGPQGDIRIIKEFVERDVSTDALCDAIASWPFPIQTIYCDPAGDAQNVQTLITEVFTLRNRGFHVRFSTKPRDRAREAGEDRVRARIVDRGGNPALFVAPDCRKTIAALESFMFEQDREGKSPGRVGHKDGVHDHPMDALRYFVVNHFPVYVHREDSRVIPFVRV